MKYSPQFASDVLVRQCGVVCSDGVELMGLALERSSIARDPERSTTFLFQPGQYDNAYQQRKNHALMEACAQRGFGCTLANSRGQDYFGYQRVYPALGDGFDFEDYRWRLFGSTFERVRQADRDITAWLDFCIGEYGWSSVILVGHSHGAVKVANFALNMSDAMSSKIDGIVLLSPSDDIAGQRQALGDRFDEGLEIARDLVRSGKEDQLMPDWAYHAPFSAGTYLEAFGPDSPLTTFSFHQPDASPLATVGSWTTRTLLLFGETDGATAGTKSEDACAIVRSWIGGAADLTTKVIAGANHHYKGYEKVVAQAVTEWAAGDSSSN